MGLQCYDYSHWHRKKSYRLCSFRPNFKTLYNWKKDIAAKPEIKISGVIPKFTTNICVVFKCRDNNFYFLRTLSIKKGFGVPEKSKTAQTAVKQAEEILEVLKNF